MAVTLIGLVIVTAAAIFIAWPLLSGGGDSDAPVVPEMSALEKDKNAALEAIRELDFDQRLGKISDEDHAGLRADLEKRAMKALSAADAGSAGEPGLQSVTSHGASPSTSNAEAGGFCSSCGNQFKRDARFCVTCGKKLLKSGSGRGRRRTGS